jgi:transcription initiation factor TFIIIB Brf1 subunit/transcription initiation factor TFIIB
MQSCSSSNQSNNANQLISEFSYRLHVDNELILKAQTLFEEYTKKSLKIPSPYLHVIAIYNSLKQQSSFRSLEDIANVSGIKSNLLWKYLKRVPQTRNFQTEEKCEYVLSSLDLPFRDIKTILEILKKIPCYNFSEKTLIVTIAYSYLNFKSKKVTIKDISVSANVSEASVNRCLKHLKARKWTIMQAFESSKEEV